jgi:hypothetical protein
MRLHAVIASLAAAAALSCERERVVVREVPAKCPACPVCPETPGGSGDHSAASGLTAKDGPEISILYHLTSQYVPVKFQHRAHVDYTTGCTRCHHHHNEVEPVPPCRECHGLSHANLARPGLNGAYHRQCMNCHRESGAGPLECTGCHERRGEHLKTGDLGAVTREYAPVTAVLGHIARKYKPVVFNHKLHEDIADRCTSCHHHRGDVEQAPPCRECHSLTTTAKGSKRLGLKDAYHTQCLACHKSMEGPQGCTDCHKANVKKGGKNGKDAAVK